MSLRMPAFALPALPALLAALLLAPAAAGAEGTARKTNEVLTSVADIARNLELADVPSPINIRADRLEFRYGSGLLRYDGNVEVEHAGASIHAGSLEVAFEPDGRRSLKRITATGAVRVVHGDESAQGELAEYVPSEGTIVLSRGARLGSGPNSLAGEKVVVYLDENRAVVLGSGQKLGDAEAGGEPGERGRIKATFVPDSVRKRTRRKR